jgi:hypothetical protein
MRHAGALRNFASTIRELAQRGHQVHLAFMMRDEEAEGGLLQQLSGEFPSLTFERVKTRSHQWTALARAVRTAADYARYLQPEFAAARPLRKRATRYVHRLVRKEIDRRARHGQAGVQSVLDSLRSIEATIPPDPDVRRFVARVKPDVLLVTPLVDFASDQVEYIKGARALGIPSALCVHSWDNLTNKGLIHATPDRVFVWNGAQQREAVLLHGIDAARVVATGAPVFDEWFDRTPATTREEFCARVGLRADRPFFLYLCSSRFIAATEAGFIVKWLAAIRAADDARVRDAGILIRPHPRTTLADPPRGDWSEFPDVAVWPRQGANPVDATSKSDYFDSMYHAAAAIGINTTAQIEAGIVGRPVYTIRAPEFSGTQEGSLHFHYLLKESGGLARFDKSLDVHTRSLADALSPAPDVSSRLQQFVEGFVRPHGLRTRATPQLADAIEALALETPAPAPPVEIRDRLRRAALIPLGIAARWVKPAVRGSGG